MRRRDFQTEGDDHGVPSICRVLGVPLSGEIRRQRFATCERNHQKGSLATLRHGG